VWDGSENRPESARERQNRPESGPRAGRERGEPRELPRAGERPEGARGRARTREGEGPHTNT